MLYEVFVFLVVVTLDEVASEQRETEISVHR